MMKTCKFVKQQKQFCKSNNKVTKYLKLTNIQILMSQKH